MSKTEYIINHLKEKGSITSLEAFELYRATRLSSIIFNLRKHYEIDADYGYSKNENGTVTRYAIYKLREE